MKHLPTTCWLLLCLITFQLNAQRFNSKKAMSFVVWTVDGSAQYSMGNDKKMDMAPGMPISNETVITLGENASVQLANERGLLILSGKGDYALNKNSIQTVAYSKAVQPFFGLLVASVPYYGMKAKAIDEGGSYGDKSGKKKLDEGSSYGDKSGKKKLDEGSSYGDRSKKQASISSLKDDPLYKNGKKVDRLLMKAATFESLGLHSKAWKSYKKALSKNPISSVANQMAKAFLDK